MTTVDKRPTELVVRKSVLVSAPQAHAFAVFTEQHGGWWPLKTHHITSMLAPIESPIRDYLRSHPACLAYAERMLVRFFPDLAATPSHQEEFRVSP